jgi:hypothetical protein
MPLLLYLYIPRCCFSMFCIVFRVLNAIFICVSLNNFVSLLVTLPLNVKVAHFVFRCCGSMSVFCFCEGGFFILFIV